MPDVWAGLAGRTVADHELTFFCEIDGIPLSGPRLPMAALAEGDDGGWPPDQLAALRGRYANEPVWLAHAAGDDIGDFHPHVGRLVNGMRPDLMRVFEPSAEAQRLLAHADLYEEKASGAARTRKQIEIRLSAAARARLSGRGLAPRPLLITVAAVRLYVFATGKGFAVVTVTVAAGGGLPNALELLEAQVALGRVNELAWLDAAGDGTPLASFALLPLVRRLAQGAAAHATTGERVSTYAFVRLEEATTASEADLLALYLARHYTTDYAVATTIEGVERIGAFETVRTAVANEGAATIIARPPEMAELPPFLERFRTATFHRHYLPIALLALHEQAFLVDRTSRAALDPAALSRPAALGTLRALLSDALSFRLGFRFSEVSYISMHNEINRAFRTVMSLDRMLRDLGDDVTVIEGFLSYRAEKARAETAHVMERRFWWTSILGVMALSGLTTFTIIKEAGEVLAEGKWVGPAAVIAGGAVALIALAIGFWRGSALHALGGHGAHDFTEHAMTEHMIHLAGKADPKTHKSTIDQLPKSAGESRHPMTPPHGH
jgi:hypothetical protein